MLNLFRKKKYQKPVFENTAQDRAAQNIVARCTKLQRHWAGFMQRKTERLSSHEKLIALIVFCFIAVGMSIFLIAGSMRDNSFIAISRIKVPLYIGGPGDENRNPTIVITEQEYLRITHFKQYMDSLASSVSGRSLYDSILAKRPALLDRVAFIINNYQSQTK